MGQPLAADDRSALLPHYSPALLGSVRIAEVERIANPPLSRAARRLGLGVLLDLETVSGMAFVDTVVLARANASRRERLPLLFHELVHVAQWREFGVAGFLRRYVGGWAETGGSYLDNPLEAQAFSLTDRFVAGEIVCVEEEVRLRAETV